MKHIFLSLCILSSLALGHEHEGGESASDETHGLILGHGNVKYRVDMKWAKADPKVAPVINSHAIAEGKDGLIYVVTDHPENAFVVFKKDGTYVKSFGKGLQGGHGLEFFEKDGEEFLVHVDCGWHFEAEGWNAKSLNGKVTILKTDGTIVRTLPTPEELGVDLPEAKKFQPCDVAITPSGTLLIADGYATDIVYELTTEGKLVKFWGGQNKKPSSLSNAHGISIDLSDPKKPLVWVSSRNECKIKAFTLDGEYVDQIELPGAFAGQLFFRGDKIYTAVCWSKKEGTGKKMKQSGFILVLDRKTKRVISAPGGSEPTYLDGVLQPMTQATKTFIHGHDLYIDEAGSIYVGEWNSNRRYPAKLTPVK